MKTVIDKEFHWEAGHRVWSQALDTKYTSRGEGCCACKFRHGHSYKMKVFLEETIPGENIKNTGMVLDFKMIGFMKDFVDDVLDHKMLIDINDPLHGEDSTWLLDDDGRLDLEGTCHKMPEGYWIPDMTKIINSMKDFQKRFGGDSIDSPKNQAIIEKYEGTVLVPFVPTSENIAGWLLEVAQNKLESLSDVKVTAIELWETPKSHCRVEI